MKLKVVHNLFVIGPGIKKEIYYGISAPCGLCSKKRRRKTRNGRYYYICSMQTIGELDLDILHEWKGVGPFPNDENGCYHMSYNDQRTRLI